MDNSLILNSPNVLVEGEVDKIILDSMYKILELDIPLESFTSLPCAGCTKVIDMAHIALTYHKMPAILLDSDDSGKKI
ncbi:TOPRIM nucleotidyl transferase/hydrolase domain-containing protein [Methanobrevibacter arboriphilus]|uniref:TOPRIM nucleotidyl transferase/hydrolase domain-containing protein n=1 Tax=Methanobrevibacter arboriphilus TaxID=39441 RepID=UPI001CDA9A35|nr:TOPRIM nucleotidyl transferase/hydrolase domain-containing protein [Methanobrevibacter arboriphilus]